MKSRLKSEATIADLRLYFPPLAVALEAAEEQEGEDRELRLFSDRPEQAERPHRKVAA